MSEQIYGDKNRNGEYHFTGEQLYQTQAQDQAAGDARNNGAPYGQTFYHEAPHTGHPKVKKPMTMGKKWAVAVSMALVFGLVAGGTMFGVNTLGNYLTGGSSREYTQLAQTQTTSSSGSGSSSESGSGTVAEVASNAMPSLVTISTMTVEEMQNFISQYGADLSDSFYY